MLKNVMIVVAVAGLITVLISGCENEAQTNALLGTGLGGGVAALTGGEGSDLMVGGAIGGGAGYLLGSEADKKKAKQQTDNQLAAIRADQNTVSVWITNSNGSQQEVRLRKSGPSFIGPRGEIYQTMPTQDQLKQVYGF